MRISVQTVYGLIQNIYYHNYLDVRRTIFRDLLAQKLGVCSIIHFSSYVHPHIQDSMSESKLYQGFKLTSV